MTVVVQDFNIPVADGCLFARQWSPDLTTREPIILLHDSLGSVELWRDFPKALAQATERPVIAYDRLGFGQSTRRHQSPGVNFILEEAEIVFPALTQALGIASCLLLGHSVGGAMALTIAALHLDKCSAVITESAQAFVEPLTLEGIRAAQKHFSDPQKFARLTRYHGDKAQWVLDAWTEVWLSPEFASWSLDPYLPRIQCPVLALHGDADEYGSEAFPRQITEQCSGPSLMKILEDCGHVPHREKPTEVLALVTAFVNRALPN